jgi:hypothetical protein
MSGAQAAEPRGMLEAQFYGFSLEWHVPRARDRGIVNRAEVLWSRTTRDEVLRSVPS